MKIMVYALFLASKQKFCKLVEKFPKILECQTS